ncbi:DUF3558 domain-containing protein [Gordonia neofelifaecis]|uniref:DUF3558 domain-containing protein n=1 Tax=Gordonia neofelifaecis NRRL B-59395 TaxID=644548 RepID=F1YM72_9ACTN|nr:DUF3558 domain-containing protein [Gordonia neofelifaecis]EGD54323.1 hypothetical protein SCNU_15081 [Gordonia neofelifaecis NRRL B-59395]
MIAVRRGIAVIVAVLAVGITLAACTVDGEAVREGRAVGTDKGHVDTDQFDKLLAECEVLPSSTIAKAVGGTTAESNFFGANCRWIVQPQQIDVTFNWFEWGDYNLEKETAQNLGFTTENISVQSQAAFTQRDPKRPQVCGVTAKSPAGGIFTWWVEPEAAQPGDPCAGPIKLMELILTGAN